MLKGILYTILMHLFGFQVAFAQNLKQEISGKVVSEGEGVGFALIGLKGTAHGITADAAGNFTLKEVPAGTYDLVVSAIGFQNYKKTVGIGAEKVWLQVELKKSLQQLQEVVVSGTMKETYTMQSPIHVEVYTPKLFQKNPTPSIFEAMQMVNGVQPQLNCNVCNTGDIHINGMEGPYTMVTIDGMPIVSSLGSVYGLSGIPNSMIQRVEVVKGPASTLYGSEAVGGLINIITKNPVDAPLVATDLMATSHGELNADVAVKKDFGTAQSLLGINAFSFQNRRDVNDDNFTDITLHQRISLFNKWNFNRKENRLASLAARYLYEDRWGGEMNWQPAFRGGDSIYGESIFTKRVEVIGAYALPVKEKMTLQFSYNNHRQNSAYGAMRFLANQHIAFAQLLWNKTLERHDIMFGLPFRFDFYDDNTVGTQQKDGKNKPQQLYLPGIFLQDEITINEKLTSLPGLRFDYNSAHGGIFSPRLGFKFAPNNHNTFRLNAGNGYRIVNLFTEDHAALTGSREIIIKDDLKPERSWNASLNYQKFIDLDKGFLNLDGSLFYTYFTNKILGDFLTNPDQIIYQNLQGHSISRGITLNADWMFAIPLKLNAGATFMEVYTMQKAENGAEEKQPQLHAPKVSATYAITYTFSKISVSVDYTGRLYGPMHLPVLENDFRPGKSPWFSQDNLQLTKKLRHGFEIYGGVKNLYNFLPKDPLMRPFDPFDKHVNENNPEGYTFDTTYNYAPMQGRRLFLGVRWNLG
ncbi:TonB-dependent receptor [Adhaeribacter sp. BT258]|uniref:TonB-dependent receptor n=1 Tax=Adhaeribacter terrigena TaxID=2793070 RepID=A0ABS1BY28_9BACT|nr:TonB-dependent receptor [Adhaeribacter terrigena]MBK0402070.1 TonB-dependent receptor [Adhaeribacter terrigena]